MATRSHLGSMWRSTIFFASLTVAALWAWTVLATGDGPCGKCQWFCDDYGPTSTQGQKTGTCCDGFGATATFQCPESAKPEFIDGDGPCGRVQEIIELADHSLGCGNETGDGCGGTQDSDNCDPEA